MIREPTVSEGRPRLWLPLQPSQPFQAASRVAESWGPRRANVPCHVFFVFLFWTKKILFLINMFEKETWWLFWSVLLCYFWSQLCVGWTWALVDSCGPVNIVRMCWSGGNETIFWWGYLWMEVWAFRVCKHHHIVPYSPVTTSRFRRVRWEGGCRYVSVSL